MTFLFAVSPLRAVCAYEGGVAFLEGGLFFTLSTPFCIFRKKKKNVHPSLGCWFVPVSIPKLGSGTFTLHKPPGF